MPKTGFSSHAQDKLFMMRCKYTDTANQLYFIARNLKLTFYQNCFNSLLSDCAHMFKTNEVISQQDVKFSDALYSNTLPIFFAECM